MKNIQKQKQAIMFSVIENWQQSKQSQYKFCKVQKLSLSTFQYWLKKYRDSQGGSQTKGLTKTSLSHQRFLTLDVSEVEHTESTDNFTISYPNGVQLSCSSTTNTQTLRNLINL